MQNMTLEHIASACGGQYIGNESRKTEEIQGAVTDSRQVGEGFLFIPVVGERVDGHDFIGQVFEKGALATLSERRLESCPGPYIMVESSLQALKDIAAFYRSQLTIPVVGITGSVGKTSTKEMIAATLSVKYNVLKTAGNFNNEIGLPLTLLRIQPEHQVAVVEMGISDFGEMHRLGRIACPDICVITNIGTCHLENLIDRDGVLRAKTEVFDHLRPHAAVYLNGNDDKLAKVYRAGDSKPVFYGLGAKESGMDDSKFQIYITETESLGLMGSRAMLHTPQGAVQVEIPIPGIHNLYNAMAAAGIGLRLGLTLEEIREGLRNARTIAGRSNLIEKDGILILDDCYNANPMSMKASIGVLVQGAQRKIAVLGDMGELGSKEKQLHREVGEYAAKAGVDVLFCVGELAQEMAEGAREALENAAKDGALEKARQMQIFSYATKEAMLPGLLKMKQPGDTILVKASHFMNFGEIVKALT